MNLVLAFMFQNERPWLEVMVPVLAAAGLPMLAVDGGSSDGGADVVRQHGGEVLEHAFTWDFGGQQNYLIDQAEARGFDALLLTAPDELMFADHLRQLPALLEQYKVLVFPRINFEEDRYHYCPYLYPDWQGRAWWLGHGVRWTGQHHATISESLNKAGWTFTGNTSEGAPHDVMRIPHMPIFHYEGTRGGFYRALKQLNYNRTKAGQPPLPDLPRGMLPVPYRFRIRYTGAQPVVPVDADHLTTLNPKAIEVKA